ncbi:hypothetical protein [Microbacterium sp.]|uniref:hypothetical protein n=1 Tax=Microbacterium sp. TaxID=51671 RepID=UPI003A8D453F
MRYDCDCRCHDRHRHEDDRDRHEDEHGGRCELVIRCEEPRCADHRHDDGDEPGGGGKGPGDGTVTVGWNNPGRPGHVTGTSSGDVPGGTLTPGDFDPQPPNRWPGPRGDLYLPFLFLRANPGDLGARPVVGPFWESPDILLLAGTDPATAPPVPPALGQNALAGKPNTLYAHVWNFGIGAAPNVVVEFYWCDPTLGIGPAGANLVGQTMTSLGARGSGHAHTIVKCPVAWTPTFVNGGHECLVVRVWEETSDGLGTPPWDAALNRHVAQRNIHVVAAGDPGNPISPHLLRRAPVDEIMAALAGPLTLNVGPLFGEPAEVAVERAAPASMPWLQLRTGVRGMFPAQAPPTGDLVLTAPRPVGAGAGFGGGGATQLVTHDDNQVTFSTGDAPPQPGQAHVYRVTASQQGQVFGGYTVVLLG